MSTTTRTNAPHIVVGVDHRPSMRCVLEWAAREAVLRHAPITLVHAVGCDLDLEAVRAGEDMGQAISRATLDARRVLDEARAVINSLAPEVVVVQHVSLDTADVALRSVAPSPSLVVVGSRSTLDAHELHCPVIEVAGSPVAGSLLAIADGTVWSVPVLTAAFEEAALRGLSVTVVQVLSDPLASEAATGPSILGFLRTLLHQQVHELQVRFPSVAVHVASDDEADLQLTGGVGTATYVVTDSTHLHRLHLLTDQPEWDRGVIEVVPCNRPGSRREVAPDIDLESWWTAPTVDEPPLRTPVRVRVRRLRRHLEP